MTLSDTSLHKIRGAVGEIDRARQRLDRLVAKARHDGATWTEVGFALGITAQGAQKRYGAPQERQEAHQASQARRAAKRATKRSSEGGGNPPVGVDPWPDGTTQGTIRADDTGD